MLETALRPTTNAMSISISPPRPPLQCNRPTQSTHRRRSRHPLLALALPLLPSSHSNVNQYTKRSRRTAPVRIASSTQSPSNAAAKSEIERFFSPLGHGCSTPTGQIALSQATKNDQSYKQINKQFRWEWLGITKNNVTDSGTKWMCLHYR